MELFSNSFKIFELETALFKEKLLSNLIFNTDENRAAHIQKDGVIQCHLVGPSLTLFLPGGTLGELGLWNSQSTVCKLLPQSIGV